MILKRAKKISESTTFLIIIACIAYAFLSVGSSLIKELGEKFHTSQIVVFLSSIQLTIAIVYGYVKRGAEAFRTKKPWPMFTRAVIGTGLTFLSVYALPHIELTTYFFISFTAPFWLTILSAVLLKDVLTKTRLSVTLFGLMVIFTVLRPSGDNLDWWTLVVFGMAVLSATNEIVVRYIGKNESRSFMVIACCLLEVLIFAPIMVSHYIAPTMHEWLIFITMSYACTVGVLTLFYALQTISSASIIAPYNYTQIIWGAILGYFIFGNVPSMEIVIGSALITLSGLYLIYSERKNGKS